MLTCSRRQFQFAAVAIVLLTVATRLPSFLHPQAIDDEAVYSIVANEIVDGGRPYVDAVERKPRLLFWTYAALFEVRENPTGKRCTPSRLCGRWGRWLVSTLSADVCSLARLV